MKKLLLILTIALLTLKVGHSQTNVSGGIYSNTIWTLVNSPYIVVDTVVVFPGVTLTIQPGVVVKFANNKRLEIRQAKLIALGTITDSITFTSNSGSPTPGIWSEIFLNGGTGLDTIKFDYCNFRFANNSLNFQSYNILILKNSNFYYNNTGIYCIFNNGSITAFIDTTNFLYNVNYGVNGGIYGIVNYCNIAHNQVGLIGQGWNAIIKNCTVDSNSTGIQVFGFSIENCFVRYNQIGISGGGGWGYIKNSSINYNTIKGLHVAGDSITNCDIKNNGIGFSNYGAGYDPNVITKNVIENNSIGIKIDGSSGFGGDQIYCNKICNNTTYNLYYNVAFGGNATFPSNYWCTADSASTEVVIYDGYDNINLGLVNFMPLDTLQCYLVTGIPINEFQNLSFSIFPNPFSSSTTLHADKLFKNAAMTVYNSFGQTVKQINNFSGQTVTFHRDNLPSGLYFIRLTQDSKVITIDKLVITD